MPRRLFPTLVLLAAALLAPVTGDRGLYGVSQEGDPSIDLSSWCPGAEATMPDSGKPASFALENGKTVSICRSGSSSELTYFYGSLGELPEMEYRGPLLGTFEGLSGYSHDLAGLGRYGFSELWFSPDVSPATVAEAARASDSGGFFFVSSVGCCGGAEESYLFRHGGWEYALRVGYSRGASAGGYSEWKLITLISPDESHHTIR